eukprot:403351679
MSQNTKNSTAPQQNDGSLQNSSIPQRSDQNGDYIQQLKSLIEDNQNDHSNGRQQQVQGRDHFLNHRNDKFQQQKLNLNQKPINTNQQQQQLQLNKKQSNSPEKKQSTLTKNVVKFNLTSQTFGNQRPNNFRPKQTTQQQISPNKPNAISNGHQPSTGGFPNNNKQKYQNKQKQAVDDEMPNQAQKHTVTQDDLPIFLRKDHIRDAKMRRPSDPNYDKTTLHIPHNEWKQFTQCMVQYWKIKSENFDKIIFFKLGKFYEIFDYDAEICNKLLDINFMNNQNRMHVGFPEKNKDKYAEVLVQNGLTVMVVEQMLENKNQAPNKVLNKNYHQNPYKKYEKECVTRDICQIYSRGTFTDIERAQYDSKYVLALKIDNVNIGLCYFDVSTNKCFLGQFEDDESFNTLRTILAQIRAVEVIAEKGLINQQIEKMIKSSPQSPILHQYRQDQCPTALRTVTTFEKYIQEEKKSIDDFEVLKKLRQDSKILALQAFGIAIKFLENHLLATSCLKLFRYQLFEPKSMEYSAEFMILDSAAIEQLELIPVESTTQLQIEKKFERFNPNLQKDQQVILQKPNTSQATLFDFINHTKTDFGNRLLKKWLLAPLMDIDKINDRLDAIEDLIQDTTYLHEFRDNISKMPDLDSLKSYRLDKLLTIKSDQDPNGLIPSLGKLIEEFEYLIVWKKVSGSEKEFIPEPHEGLSKQFDDTNAKVTKMKQQLDDYLKQIREQILKINEGRFKKQIDQIGFTHSKFRYEIEVPLELVDGNKKPKEFELTSNKNGFQRFQTPQLKEMIEELEELEEELKEAIIPFVYALFQRFYDNRSYWDQAVMVMAELDCLTSLAIASQHQAPMCRPQFLKYEGRYRKKAYLELRQMRHPCIDLKQAQKSEKQQKKFVPNDTLINNSKSNTRILLVTGPNMGGKSTLLRQTCLAVILAQIGCFVPAESCILTPVDRIFTRIGASDRILEGKSTFFVEMEETNTILKNATFKSLAILDELGRGTSTFDGYSIAHAVLNYLTNYIKCRSLFSTHYHLLLDKFRDVEGIKSYHMACKQSETEQDRIEFLYKFIEGDCPQSFGMNVAKMAGLPINVIRHAKLKSQEFSKKMSKMIFANQNQNYNPIQHVNQQQNNIKQSKSHDRDNNDSDYDYEMEEQNQEQCEDQNNNLDDLIGEMEFQINEDSSNNANNQTINQYNKTKKHQQANVYNDNNSIGDINDEEMVEQQNHYQNSLEDSLSN